MKERSVTEKQMETLRFELPGAFLIKHSDKFTAGIPDLSVSWKRATTWIENKLLEPTQQVHDELSLVQLATCVRLEQQTGRCWIVAYRRGLPRRRDQPACTFIYRPTFLRNQKVPQASTKAGSAWDLDGICDRLWTEGVLQCEGFAHQVLADVIRRSHR